MAAAGGEASSGSARSAERRRLVREVANEARDILVAHGEEGLSSSVLRAMLRVPREDFVPAAASDLAYVNHALAIGRGQTISQPLIVALMTHLLGVGRGDSVLEVGTGSGYQAAVLAEVVAHVYSIEAIRDLGEAAIERLAAGGYGNVEVRIGDGREGWPEHAPYEGVIVTAASPDVPEALVRQLRAGGNLVMPLGGAAEVQWLVVLHKDASGAISSRRVLPVRFVPLVGGGTRG